MRNPWAYYVSWYHFQLGVPKRNILFQLCSNEGRLGFKETVANLVDLSGDEQRLALLEAGLAGDLRQGRDQPDQGMRAASCGERGIGFYSFLYERLYAGAAAPTILRAERLSEELRAVLEKLGELPNACAEQFLDRSPPLNVSRHDAPSPYL